MHLRHAQHAAGTHDFAHCLEFRGLGGRKKIDLVFGRQQPLPAFDQRAGGAGAGGVGNRADQPAVKIAVLLRELGAEIRDDHAAARRELFDAGIDVAQKALAAEGRS